MYVVPALLIGRHRLVTVLEMNNSENSENGENGLALIDDGYGTHDVPPFTVKRAYRPHFRQNTAPIKSHRA